ncbi:MAG: hypothetical protein HXY20_03960 [Acidobacteria bacterium]|nr:hypothetical protein [Acidobacteriota bacterium]
MNRRDFLAGSALSLGIAGAASPPAVGLARSAPVQGAARPLRLMMFDTESLAERSQAEVVPPPLKKLGILIEPDSPGDAGGVSTAMGCGFTRDERGRLRLYYTGYSKPARNSAICIAESDDAIHWTKPALGQVKIDGIDTNRLEIRGLPEGVTATQPSLVRAPDGSWRLYFWAIGGKLRVLRYVAANSPDGLHWKVVDFAAPCLKHLLELSPKYSWAWLDGPESQKVWAELGGKALPDFLALKWAKSNDATHTYASPGGGFEMFSVWPLPNRPGSGRRVEPDNSKEMVRCIHRRTSDDGLRWSDPELVLVPDGADPWDQQFYYLSQHHLTEWRIGFLGSYRIVAQDMNVEMVCSRDGRRWHRPMRGAWVPRGPKGSVDSVRIYMPSHLVDRQKDWLCLYTGFDTRHDQDAASGRQAIHGLEIPRYRFAGLAPRNSLTARIRTNPFILPGTAVKIDAAVAGELRAELCDAFGKPLPGLTIADCVPFAGDSEAHVLKWKNAGTADYQYDAVSLRLEWEGGTVYSVFA